MINTFKCSICEKTFYDHDDSCCTDEDEEPICIYCEENFEYNEEEFEYSKE